MNKTVRTEKELSSAVNNSESRITVGGSLGNAVLRISFIKPLDWRILIAAIKAAVFGFFEVTEHIGISLPTVAAASGDADVAKVLERIAVSGGGIHTLHALRKYKAKREGGYVVLTRQ